MVFAEAVEQIVRAALFVQPLEIVISYPQGILPVARHRLAVFAIRRLTALMAIIRNQSPFLSASAN